MSGQIGIILRDAFTAPLNWVGDFFARANLLDDFLTVFAILAITTVVIGRVVTKRGGYND